MAKKMKLTALYSVLAVLSLLPVFVIVWIGAFRVFLLASMVVVCVDLNFAILQRYSRPRLIKQAEGMKRWPDGEGLVYSREN